MKIDSFTGNYRWLSNFASADVVLDGVHYASVEHAYQAAKTNVKEERMQIRSCPTAGRAKQLGRHVTMRSDWHAVKLDVMYELVKQKFNNNVALASMLRGTGDAELEEGNYWNDTYWGVCKGKGENHLGKILMRVRKELNEHQQ